MSSRSTNNIEKYTELHKPKFPHNFNSYESEKILFGNGNQNVPPRSAHSETLSLKSNTQFSDARVCKGDNNYIYHGVQDPNGSNSTNVTLSSFRPGSVKPNETQLNLAFAYGIRRPDGRVTRLIRADHLNSSAMNPHIPQWQTEEGLIILPEPRQPSPDRRHGYDPIVSQEEINEINCLATSDPGEDMRNLDKTQSQIDAIISTNKHGGRSSSVSTSLSGRRQKIYCDKWVHEGVCAFTQVGCKFKHEMPNDKATQISLGLNHGYPNWYRRACANAYLSPSLSAPLPSPIRPIDGNWRRSREAGYATPAQTAEYSTPNARPIFGPIAPPPQYPICPGNSYHQCNREGLGHIVQGKDCTTLMACRQSRHWN
ncbi:BgTH12-06364 [Blumeria graminis f. sp. triticale]|uniref:BgTH12-06364 n=1 Tax=Blumeria graminis f. sp. triticale TaxID=1689686 RepID=A0A9W4D3J6_BLUGR|nr:BgTH12-06364 [Blumeria graminis f. sp. triticale]